MLPKAGKPLRRSRWEQVAGLEKAGRYTIFRKLAVITNHVFVIDNRGLDEPNTEKTIEELSAQIDGKRSYSEIVRWENVDKGAGDDLHLKKSNIHDQHSISCAVLVFSSLHDLETITTGLTEIVDCIHMRQGRYPLAVITHEDVAERDAVEKLCTFLQTNGVNDIFKVANLNSYNRRLDEYYQLILLNLMNKCMIEGDETLIFKYDVCKWRELMRRHEMMISECARTGAQRHEYPDSFALERERMAALKRERVAVLERERSKAQGQEREATLEREGEAALERERVAALKWKREVALEREKVAVLERERSEALERERSEAQERERMAALEQERMAALERERMVALERERVAILGRERSEAQGREREAALEDTIMGMKRDMQIMVTAERERQASREDSKQGTKMPFNPERETSPSSPPSRTSLMEQLRGAFSSKTRQTSHRSTGETLDNISGAQEDFDKQLTTVAQKVARRDEIDNLGKALGFEPEDIQRYVDTNMKSESYMGTLSMLRDWRKKQTKAKECGALNSVLMKVRQIRLADELFGTS